MTDVLTGRASTVEAVEGNERLTAWAGAALLAGFGAELLTLLDVHWYLTYHVLIGVALFAPLSVKLASTGYRFVRYYTGDPAFVRKGPPQWALRVLAPVLVAVTAVVLLSGVALVVTHWYHRETETLHLWATWLWVTLAAVHVLAYLAPTGRSVLADLNRRGTTPAAVAVRLGLVAGSGVVGLTAGAVAVAVFLD